MRKFKFRPTFLAYITLVSALFVGHEYELMLTLFHQIQQLGYEVSVHFLQQLFKYLPRGAILMALFPCWMS